MICYKFEGSEPEDTVLAYNNWAKDKPLTKDVIVHSYPYYDADTHTSTIIILVFFDEKIHPSW